MLGREGAGRGRVGGQRNAAFSGHPRGAGHPPSAGQGATRWEGTLEDYQGEGTPNTAAAPFSSFFMICQAGPWQKLGQNHEVGVRPRTLHRWEAQGSQS